MRVAFVSACKECMLKCGGAPNLESLQTACPGAPSLADTLAAHGVNQPEAGSLGLMVAMGPGFCAELVLLRW